MNDKHDSLKVDKREPTGEQASMLKFLCNNFPV